MTMKQIEETVVTMNNLTSALAILNVKGNSNARKIISPLCYLALGKMRTHLFSR